MTLLLNMALTAMQMVKQVEASHYFLYLTPADIMAPISSDVFPSSGVGFDQFPIASIRFNEPLDTAAFDSSTMYYLTSGRRIPGELAYYEVGSESVLNYFPSEPLLPNAYHLLSISKHISDTLGNALGRGILKVFQRAAKVFVLIEF